MSSDSKFFIGVVVVAVAALAGIIFFSSGNRAETTLSRQTLEVGENVKGSENPTVTIVEFSDFQCPACKVAADGVEVMLGKEKDVKFIYRYFPLPSHQNGFNSALAAEAARRQDRFWPMHDLLFDKQEIWGTTTDPESLFLSYATELGLNAEQFRNDYKSDDVRKVVQADYDFANTSGINQTPTFFINGAMSAGAKSPAEWEQLIAEVRSAVSTETETAPTTN